MYYRGSKMKKLICTGLVCLSLTGVSFFLYLQITSTPENTTIFHSNLTPSDELTKRSLSFFLSWYLQVFLHFSENYAMFLVHRKRGGQSCSFKGTLYSISCRCGSSELIRIAENIVKK